MDNFGVRRTKIGADGKQVAYVVSFPALVAFCLISGCMLGLAAYYSWALESQVEELEKANGWTVGQNLDEETELAHHFFHSAEILLTILASEKQTVEDGVQVSAAVQKEIEQLKTRVAASESFDQLVAVVEEFDVAAGNIVEAYADSNLLLSERAKMLSKSLTGLLSDGVGNLEKLQEWKQINTWHKVSRCFAMINDATTVEIPKEIEYKLTEELAALEAGQFPAGNYERPNDVREEMEQLLSNEGVKGIRFNIIKNARTADKVQEILREVLQVLVVQENMAAFRELETEWRVDGEADEDILDELIDLEDDGLLPTYWVAGPDILGVRSRKFLWWVRPSAFDVLDVRPDAPPIKPIKKP